MTAIIFVISLSSYDEMPFEEDRNAMSVSIEVLDEQINSEWFKDTPFIVLLNKVDIFYDKIKTVPITLSLCILFK